MSGNTWTDLKCFYGFLLTANVIYRLTNVFRLLCIIILPRMNLVKQVKVITRVAVGK